MNFWGTIANLAVPKALSPIYYPLATLSQKGTKMKTYPNCNANASDDTEFCASCGFNTEETTEKQEEIITDFYSETAVLVECNTNATKVKIPDYIVMIAYNAFRDCGHLTNIEIPNSVRCIDSSAFAQCENLTSIEIPSSVVGISDFAFEDCINLKSVKIFDGATYIGRYAFRNCTCLTSIEIPNTVTRIGEYAFCNCTSLTSIKIPSSVERIDYGAFEGCTNLTNIEFPDGVTVMEKPEVYVDLTECNTEKFWIEAEDLTPENFTKNDGDSLWDEDDNNLNFFGRETYIDRTTILNRKNLTDVEIPSTITTIGYRAFTDCTTITSVKIPNSVTSIGKSAFRGCTNLTSIEIPSSVTVICDWAFFNCTNLKSIKLSRKCKLGLAWKDNCPAKIEYID